MAISVFISQAERVRSQVGPRLGEAARPVQQVPADPGHRTLPERLTNDPARVPDLGFCITLVYDLKSELQL